MIYVNIIMTLIALALSIQQSFSSIRRLSRDFNKLKDNITRLSESDFFIIVTEKFKRILLSKNEFLILVILFSMSTAAVILTTTIAKHVTKMPDFGLISFTVLIFLTLKNVTLNLIIDENRILNNKKDHSIYAFKVLETWGYSLGTWGMIIQFITPIIFRDGSNMFTFWNCVAIGVSYILFLIIIYKICQLLERFIDFIFNKLSL